MMADAEQGPTLMLRLPLSRDAEGRINTNAEFTGSAGVFR
jgi:hypothetical protein